MLTVTTDYFPLNIYYVFEVIELNNVSVTEMRACFKCVNKTMFYTALNALDVHFIAFNANDTPLHETIYIQYILIKNLLNI